MSGRFPADILTIILVPFFCVWSRSFSPDVADPRPCPTPPRDHRLRRHALRNPSGHCHRYRTWSQTQVTRTSKSPNHAILSGRGMRITRLVVLLLIALVSRASAQYEVRKSANGYDVVSKVPGRAFTVNVPGKDLTPYGADSADHPYLMVDGRFLQVLSVPLAEFHGTASASDEAVLRQQMHYESDYWHAPADQPRVRKPAPGRTALVWSLTVQGKHQIFCTIRNGNYVVILGSAVEGGHTIAELQRWLIRIASSLHASS